MMRSSLARCSVGSSVKHVSWDVRWRAYCSAACKLLYIAAALLQNTQRLMCLRDL